MRRHPNELHTFLLRTPLKELCPAETGLPQPMLDTPLFKRVKDLADMMPGNHNLSNLYEIVMGSHNPNAETQKAMAEAVRRKLHVVPPEIANFVVEDMNRTIRNVKAATTLRRARPLTPSKG